jgi:hypothetical protein
MRLLSMVGTRTARDHAGLKKQSTKQLRKQFWKLVQK